MSISEVSLCKEWLLKHTKQRESINLQSFFEQRHLDVCGSKLKQRDMFRNFTGLGAIYPSFSLFMNPGAVEISHLYFYLMIHPLLCELE